MFELLGLIGVGLGVMAFFMVRKQKALLGTIEERLRGLEFRQRDLMRDVDGQAAGRKAEVSKSVEVTDSATSKPPRPISKTTADKEAPASKSIASASPPVPPEEIAAAARDIGFEERLGTRWAVWVGGVALALGAILLVRYSIEQGIFGPGVRVALGALLATVLIAAGEWLRRGEVRVEFEGIPSAHIPGVLTAAGTVAGFGTIYAAHALYGFIGPAIAFTLLGAAGIAAMLAASLHGPALAGLGLAASFATPALVSSSTPNPWPVVLFLGAIAGSAYALSAARRWPWLALSAAAGGVIWGIAIALEATGQRDWIVPAMAHAVVQLGLAAYFLAFKTKDGGTDETEDLDCASVAVFAGLALLSIAVLAANNGVSPASVVFAGLAAAILCASGLWSAALAPALALAGTVVLAKLLIWPSESGSRFDMSGLTDAWTLFTPPLHRYSFAAFAAIAALAVAVVCGMRILNSPRLKSWSAGFYAATATVLPLAALVIAYLRMTGFERSSLFTVAALGLAGLFVFVAATFENNEKSDNAAPIRLATGAFAAAAVTAAALALVFYLDRGYLTVALAIAALGTAVIADRKAIPALRIAVAALGLVVLARLVWDPRIMGDDVGATPIFNWLLFGYGIPALAFHWAARILGKTGDDTASRLSEVLSVLFAGLLAFFEIRHLLNDGDVFAAKTDHVELGLMVLTSLGFAYALMRSGIARKSPVIELASMIYGGLSAVGSVLGLLLIHNPLFSTDPVRSFGPIDSLVLAYLIPSLAAAFLARHARGKWPSILVLAVAALAIALIFTFVTLEVRYAFQGPYLGLFNTTTQPEIWSYSAAWLMLGIALLGYGLWRVMPEARLASAGIVVLVVLKVFLWDMADLDGAWRAFSFIGLGLVLVAIGHVYQRYVFGNSRPANS